MAKNTVDIFSVAHAESIVFLGSRIADTLIGLIAGPGRRTLPISDALIAQPAGPSSLTKASVGFLAKSVSFMTSFQANRLITQMSGPSFPKFIFQEISKPKMFLKR